MMTWNRRATTRIGWLRHAWVFGALAMWGCTIEPVGNGRVFAAEQLFDFFDFP